MLSCQSALNGDFRQSPVPKSCPGAELPGIAINLTEAISVLAEKTSDLVFVQIEVQVIKLIIVDGDSKLC